MDAHKLAELLALKYKVAVDQSHLDVELRNYIDALFDVVNIKHGILRAMADSGASKARTEEEKSAVQGFKFIQELVGIIDFLKSNRDTVSPEDMKKALVRVKSLIEKNLEVQHAGRNVQFPHVSDLIWAMMPRVGKVWDDRRKSEAQKARTGLSRVMSITVSMLEKLKEMGVGKKTHEESRFDPQRGELPSVEIMPFLREHGAAFGINSPDDWSRLFLDDPQLKSQLTTIINAINRGHRPADAGSVKQQIADVLREHQARKATNEQAFEEGEDEPKTASQLARLLRKYQ